MIVVCDRRRDGYVRVHPVVRPVTLSLAANLLECRGGRVKLETKPVKCSDNRNAGSSGGGVEDSHRKVGVDHIERFGLDNTFQGSDSVCNAPSGREIQLVNRNAGRLQRLREIMRRP
jgi:hypothetical protein